MDSVDVGHSPKTATGNNPFMVGPDSDQYKPEDSTNSLAMNTLDLYKKMLNRIHTTSYCMGVENPSERFTIQIFRVASEEVSTLRLVLSFRTSILEDAGFTVGHSS